MDRRLFLMASTATIAGAAGFPARAGFRHAGTSAGRVDPEVDELQRRTFDWFVHVTDRERGLTPDRWPTEAVCSVAAVGFALTCWPVGVERGWMSRVEARTRTLNTLRFFHDAPRGPGASGASGHRGFFYGFLDPETGHRFGQVELSTVDTAVLVAGMLFAGRFFDGDDAGEAEIRRLAQAIYDQVEWDWVALQPNRISTGWHPQTGFIEADRQVWNEGMLALLLAIGSETHPVSSTVWDEWCGTHDRSWTDAWGPGHLDFEPMPGHLASHMFVDCRGIRDAWMLARSAEIGGFDYFENSRRAVEAQRRYAVDNPGGWDGYSADVWGLSACCGPGDFKQVIDARERRFFSHSARGPGALDDGTIAPAAAMASYAFAPTEVTACLRAMKARYGEAIYTRWGFLGSFNPTLTEREGRLLQGRIIPGTGWVDGDYRGIDQGPIVVMIENGRSDLLWRHMRGEPNLTRGLRRAGFTGGWLDA